MPWRNTDPIPELKAALGRELARLLDGYRAWDIAPSLGIDQPRLSNLRSHKLDRFSLESLMRYMCRLGYNVELRFDKLSYGPRARSEIVTVGFNLKREKKSVGESG